MKRDFFLLFLIFGCVSMKAQKFNSDTLRVVVETKFGELTFTNYCRKDKLEFVQSGNKTIFDEDVEREAQEKNMTKDKIKMKFTLDSLGKLESCEIIKPSKLERLNAFLLELFNDAIQRLSSVKYSLSCNRERKTYLVPVNYEAQKKK
jgi:hypothetical protein